MRSPSYILKDVTEGEKYMLSDVLERIVVMGLTEEERELALGILCDLGEKEIAEIIGRGPDAVKKRMIKLRRKLGIRTASGNDRVNAFRAILGLK